MSKENIFEKIPIIRNFVRFLDQIFIPGFGNYSFYDIGELYFTGIIRGALTARAGGIAFSFLTAIFPFLIFILTLIKYIPIQGFHDDLFYMIGQWLPPNTSKVAQEQVINYIYNHNYGGMLSFYFLVSVFFMSNGIMTLFGGFENSYFKLDTRRTYFRQYAVALGVSILLALYLLTTVAVTFYFELALEKLREAGLFNNNFNWTRLNQTLFYIAMVFISVSTLFYFGTKHSRLHKFISPGSIMTTLLMLLLGYFFGIYVVKFSVHNELYGSIGTLLIFMLYLWLNSILLLLGFELNAGLHHIKTKNLTNIS